MEEDNWLNKEHIQCPNCKKELLICDHSPMENSCRLYCDSCPRRVDIGLYESVYDDIENYKNLSYNEVLIELEKRLDTCKCGGSFQLNAKRRCLHCNHALDLKEEQNVWLSEYWNEFDSEEEEESIEKKMNEFIVKPMWKK